MAQPLHRLRPAVSRGRSWAVESTPLDPIGPQITWRTVYPEAKEWERAPPRPTPRVTSGGDSAQNVASRLALIPPSPTYAEEVGKVLKTVSRSSRFLTSVIAQLRAFGWRGAMPIAQLCLCGEHLLRIADRPDHKLYDAVAGLSANFSNWASCLRILKCAREAVARTPGPYAWTMKACASASEWERGLRVHGMMIWDKVDWSSGVSKALFALHGVARAWQRAVGLLGEVPRQRVARTRQHYAETVAACARAVAWEAALAVARQCEWRSGPGEAAAEKAVHALALSARWEEAARLLRTRAPHNEAATGSAVLAAARASAWRRGLGVYAARGQPINVHAALTACAHGAQWESGIRLARETEGSVRGWRRVLHYRRWALLCRLGLKWSQALGLVDKGGWHEGVRGAVAEVCSTARRWRVALSLAGNSQPFEAAGAVAAGSRWDRAASLLTHSQRCRRPVSDSVLHSTLWRCAEGRHWQQALELWQSTGCSPTLSLGGAATILSARWWRGALGVLRGQQGSEVLRLKALCLGHRWEAALGSLGRMRRPPVHCTRAAAEACVRAEQWRTAFGLVAKEGGAKPPPRLVSVCVRALHKMLRWEAALLAMTRMLPPRPQHTPEEVEDEVQRAKLELLRCELTSDARISKEEKALRRIGLKKRPLGRLGHLERRGNYSGVGVGAFWEPANDDPEGAWSF
eukprot:Hpha_TRINITY_DN1534_c0_g1::TRINITY_DN1534_c0_g1_i1::g.57128::m.57128